MLVRTQAARELEEREKALTLEVAAERTARATADQQAVLLGHESKLELELEVHRRAAETTQRATESAKLKREAEHAAETLRAMQDQAAREVSFVSTSYSAAR